MEAEVQTSTKLAPENRWTVYTEGTLRGLSLAREAGFVVAWDESSRLSVFNLAGVALEASRAPGKVAAGVVSDDGSRIVLLGESGAIWFLDRALRVVQERQGPPEATALAIDPHGRYVAVASRTGMTQFYNKHGKPSGRLETIQALSHLAFVADRPMLIGAAAQGLMMGFDLAGVSGGKISADIAWQERQVSNVGSLAMTGDGTMILASCFNHGVQRFDLSGNNDGSYHLGGTATRAVPDFAGRIIAVATLEGGLILLNAGGNVRWRTELPRAAIALETDPLGRYLIYGHDTGAIHRLDLFGSPNASAVDSAKPKRSSSKSANARSGIGVGTGSGGNPAASVRKPSWTAPVVSSDDQAETAVIGILDTPSRIGVFSNSLRLHLFSGKGEDLGYAPTVQGVGRIVRTSPGWMAAATDRSIVLYQANKSEAQRLEASLVEVTHLAIRPDGFGLGIVQERDRVGRITNAGRWIWKRELTSPVEDIGIGNEGEFALTTDDGKFLVFDPAGHLTEPFVLEVGEPLSLIEGIENGPKTLTWLSLARRSQVLRGHDRQGKVLWQTPVAFEAWQFLKLGNLAVIEAADGRVQAFDGHGNLAEQGSATDGNKDLLAVSPLGRVRRISRQGAHLICSDLKDRVIWRTISEQPIGPIAVSTSGVAAILGRSIAWFPGLDPNEGNA